MPHIALGALNGSLIVGLTLTTQGPIMLGGSVIGAGHSALFLLSLKYFTS